MKVAVVGAGAIGAYVGAALHRAGAEVRPRRQGPPQHESACAGE
ncbi:2-dehydropantoate 2-reductase N-terminal domain-containing protein [Streptomyces sp. NPDC005407]